MLSDYLFKKVKYIGEFLKKIKIVGTRIKGCKRTLIFFVWFTIRSFLLANFGFVFVTFVASLNERSDVSISVFFILPLNIFIGVFCIIAIARFIYGNWIYSNGVFRQVLDFGSKGTVSFLNAKFNAGSVSKLKIDESGKVFIQLKRAGASGAFALLNQSEAEFRDLINAVNETRSEAVLVESVKKLRMKDMST